MKKSILNLCFCLTAMALISSCTMQKRTYMKGYYTSGLHHKKKINNELEPTKTDISFDKEIEMDINSDIILASNDSLMSYYVEKTPRIVIKNSITREEECDIIILKDGKEIRAKVLEITSTEIKYKECSNLTGPIFTKTKSDVFMVKYPNGTNTVMPQTESKTEQSTNSNGNSSNVVVNINNSAKGNTTNKSQLVAGLLCFFMGVLGIHRFYLGYVGIGIIQFITLGFFGIWTIIDFIRILTGGLKPKKGDYKE